MIVVFVLVARINLGLNTYASGDTSGTRNRQTVAACVSFIDAQVFAVLFSAISLREDHYCLYGNDNDLEGKYYT
jgi:hypothetical protein